MQNHSVKNTPLDMEKWQEIIKRWNKSDESQKAYCERLGINLNTFLYVRSKLKRSDNQKTHFIPLTVKCSEETRSSQAIIILENPQGYKLHLSASLSPEYLSKLFKLSGWQHA